MKNTTCSASHVDHGNLLTIPSNKIDGRVPRNHFFVMMGRTVTNSIPSSFGGLLAFTYPLHVSYFLWGTFSGRILSFRINKVFVLDEHTRQEAQEVSIMGVSHNTNIGTVDTCLVFQ